MKIALLGYGKMGRMIESIAVSRGHEITARIDGYTENIDFAGADVSIDFSVPSSAVHHITSSVDAGIPVVSGTTGWTEKMPEVRKLVEEKSGALVYSSNFSLGVNIFFELNRYLARLIQPYPQYELSISETHHIHKLDAPSGTAITLAEDITGENGRYTGWALETDDIKIKRKHHRDNGRTTGRSPRHAYGNIRLRSGLHRNMPYGILQRRVRSRCGDSRRMAFQGKEKRRIFDAGRAVLKTVKRQPAAEIDPHAHDIVLKTT